MPDAIKTQCHYPRCKELVESGNYCPLHGARGYESYHRRESKRFYDSARWLKLRKWWLNRNPMCAKCSGLADQVDHVVPLIAGGHPMDIGNLQTLCRRCHGIKTREENKLIRAKD